MHEVTWPVIIAIYLFVAGDGVAAFYTGILANTFGKGNYNRVAKVGAYIGVPLIIFGLLMLIVDLGHPFRFWHFVIGENYLPLFRPSSVMSWGTWLLTAFTILGGLYALTWLSEEKFTKNWRFLKPLANKPDLRKKLGFAALPFAFLIACYTGVLLASTAAPLWNSTPFLGLLFLMSATSAGISSIILVLRFQKADRCIIYKLSKADAIVDVMELVVFVLLMFKLSSTAPEAAALLLRGEYSLM
ncbi:MAG: NrfD/PsrC family molybdoenzyme membrane anchor subunit, partial [Eubacteriales bacterium]